MTLSLDEKIPLEAPPPYTTEAGSVVSLEDASAYENEAWATAVTAFSKSGVHKEERVQRFLKQYKSDRAVQKICEDKKKKNPDQYGKIMSKILDKIGIFIKAGNLAVKAAPESVGIAWMGISIVLEAVQDDFQTLQVLGAACADIIGIMITSRLLARMFREPKGPAELKEIQDKYVLQRSSRR